MPSEAFVTAADIADACGALSRISHALSVACKAINDKPHIRSRPGGYEGLFRIIVAQQVSVPSAQAIQARCDARINALDAQTVRAMNEDELRACGLSGPKIRYLQAAAQAILDGTLQLKAVAQMDDDEASAHLCAVKGIGPWTAAIYLLFCEGRMDIWPRNDVALLAAYAAASGFSTKPAMKHFDQMASEDWAPWRGMAAHILWTYYAHLRGREPI